MNLFPSDLEIARNAKPREIIELSNELGINKAELIPYGWYRAKVSLNILDRLKEKKNGKYIIVTAITPTPLGEGKTTTTVGLTQAIGSELNKKVICSIRQPSMGPTFNIKGGAAGGGYSQCIPMEEFNLHLNGDMHAITVAHNLAAAALDTRMYHESRQSDEQLASRGISKRLDIDPETVSWRRVVDITDRSLKEIEVGHNDSKHKDGSPSPIFPRKTGYDITPASELMAILALSSDMKDLRERIGRVVLALNKKGEPVTMDDLGVSGALAVLLKDALQPNFMQTLEGQGVFVHAGPFANIAHGNSSIIADKIALKLADYVLTEGGFGADMGAEKFFNIKCRYSGLKPDTAVLVATVRALKQHGGGPKFKAGLPIPKEYTEENLELLEKGLSNLGKHIENMKKFGIPVVVAINTFPSDTEKEVEMIRKFSIENGAFDAVRSDHFAQGGKGAKDLAESVIKAADKGGDFKLLYDEKDTIKNKIETIAKEIYGASNVEYSEKAEEQIRNFEKIALDKLPICMAKTSMSISHDPNLIGAPKDYSFPVRELRLSNGAGFIYPLVGEISTMPGMVTRPKFMDIDYNVEKDIIEGLS